MFRLHDYCLLAATNICVPYIGVLGGEQTACMGEADLKIETPTQTKRGRFDSTSLSHHKQSYTYIYIYI